jgi:metallo-beta-lactamase family protein
VVAARGVLLIPAFAIGRTQDLLYHLRQLQLAGEIPASLPLFVDSPMACDATPLYLMHREEHDAEMVRLLQEGKQPLHPEALQFCTSVAQSRALNERSGPLVVISASGMATGGRILHHLAHRLPDPGTTVLFVGYQAAGTRGRRLVEGEKWIRIHGRDVPVAAKVEMLHGFSAHGDGGDVDRWLAKLPVPPRRTFCVHGEPASLEAARARFAARGWNAVVPAYQESFEL